MTEILPSPRRYAAKIVGDRRDDRRQEYGCRRSRGSVLDRVFIIRETLLHKTGTAPPPARWS